MPAAIAGERRRAGGGFAGMPSRAPQLPASNSSKLVIIIEQQQQAHQRRRATDDEAVAAVDSPGQRQGRPGFNVNLGPLRLQTLCI